MRFLFILLILFGCKAKQKTTERQRVKEVVEENIQVNERVQQEEIIDASIKQSNDTFTISNDERIEIEGNGGDTIEVQKEVIGGKTKITVSGASKVVISKSDSEVLNKEESSLETLKTTSTDILRSEDKQTKTDKSKKERKSDVSILGTSTWVSIGVGLAIFFGILLFIRKKRIV